MTYDGFNLCLLQPSNAARHLGQGGGSVAGNLLVLLSPVETVPRTRANASGLFSFGLFLPAPRRSAAYAPIALLNNYYLKIVIIRR